MSSRKDLTLFRGEGRLGGALIPYTISRVTRLLSLYLVLPAFFLFWPLVSGAGDLDLSNAVVVTAGDLPARERKAVQMLLDEIEKRTHVRLTNSHAWPSASIPVIGVGVQPAVAAFTGPYASELQAGSAPRAAAEGVVRLEVGERREDREVVAPGAEAVLKE